MEGWDGLSPLHETLIEKQPEAELERKAKKARSKGFWSQEEIDWIKRKARRLVASIKWD